VSGAPGNGQITGSWTAPADSGTASISGYKLTATPVPSGTAVSQTFNSTATTETLTGLTNGTSYNFSVAAVTSVGTGAATNATNNPIVVGVAPAITSGNNTTFTEGVNGTFTVTSTGAPTATLSASGALPSGVTFLNNGNGTATLSGTPAPGTSGIYPITITAANGVGANATQSFTLTVNAAPAITSANSTTFTEGTAGTFTVTSSASPTASLAETGALPSGVTFVDNGDGTATLAGTPAAGTAGTYPLTITATNGVLPNSTQDFSLVVNAAPAITSASSTTFTEGTSESFTVTTTGAPPPTLSESGGLPTGISFVDNGNGTATLSGTPAAATRGTYTITITAANGVGSNAVQTFTLTVNAAPAITSGASTTFTEGTAGTFTVTSSAAPTASLSEVGALPTGVTFVDNGDGTATLSGTPATATSGTYPLTITAANGVLPNATQSFTLTVNSSPTVTSADSTTFSEGVSETFGVTTTGSPDPTLSETGTLPSGVTFVDNGNGTATMAGTPAAGTRGTYTITITAANGVGANAVQSFTLTVNAAPAITSAASTTFTEGTAGTFTVTSSAAPTASLSEMGALPTGVTFVYNGDGTATLSGTPAAGTRGNYQITIMAANGVGSNAVQDFNLTVNAAPAITSASGTTFTENTSDIFTVTSSAAPDASLSESGSLPSGVTFVDNGDGTATLSGTPASGTSGTYSLTITAANGVGSNATQSFTLTVNAAPHFTSPDGITFIQGDRGNFLVTTYASPLSSLAEIGTLPPGVVFLDNGNGTAILAGTPPVGSDGSYGLFITASNGVGADATQAFTLTVAGFNITTTSVPSTVRHQPYLTVLEATGGAAPYHWTLFGGKLPKGLTLTITGVIQGQAKKKGSSTFTVQATDSSLPRYVSRVTLTIVVSQ
jgi:hypothetical protein